jgi:hypothetical protein
LVLSRVLAGDAGSGHFDIRQSQSKWIVTIGSAGPLAPGRSGQLIPFLALLPIYLSLALREERQFANSAPAGEYAASRRQTVLMFPRLNQPRDVGGARSDPNGS